MSEKEKTIRPDMTVLDVVSRFRQTESVFKKYDELAGVCICCQSLFEPIGEMARKYNLALPKLLADLEEAI